MEDRLTGLQNKKAFDKFMNEQIVIKHKKDTIWLLIHLDDLREINRIYGFDTGDEIVIAASSCIVLLEIVKNYLELRVMNLLS